MDVVGGLGGFEGFESEAKAQSGEQGAVDAQLQARQEVFVAGEDEAEERACIEVGATEKAQFFEGRGGEVLGLVDYQQRKASIEFFPALTDQFDGVAAAETRFLPEQVAQGAEDVAAGQGSVVQGEDRVFFLGKFFDAVGEQEAFPGSVGGGEHAA